MPAGESRSARPRIHPGRAANGSLSPLAVRVCWAYRCSMAASDCVTPPCPARAGRTATPSRATASASAPSPPMRSTVEDTSHLYLDEPAHPERAYHDEDRAADQHDQPDQSRVQRPHVGRVAVEEPSAYHDRQRDENVGGQPPLGAERLHLTPQEGA